TSARAAFSSASRRLARMTSAPASARPRAMALPSPWLPPVTRATLPERSNTAEVSCIGGGDALRCSDRGRGFKLLAGLIDTARVAESAAKGYGQLGGRRSPPCRGAPMTIRTFRLASALAMALALATGCGKKPPAKSDPGTVTPPVTPVKDGTKPIPGKDGNSVGEFPKVETPPALFDAVELTRKLVKEPDAATPLLNKQVRIEGVVAVVDLHPAGKDPDDARVTLYGSTDDPDQRKHVKVVCGLR